MTPALLLIGHGTRDEEAVDEVASLCTLLSARLDVPAGYSWIEHDLCEPSPKVAADRLVAAGAGGIVTVPFLAFGAGHAKTDVPELVAEVRDAHPALRVVHGRVLGLHERLFALARRRLAYARAGAGWEADVPADEALLVTGPGSSDPDANGDLAKAARFVGETSGHRWAEIAFAGVSWPTADVALRRMAAAGARRVVRLSWSLLPGRLEQRIERMAAEVTDATGMPVIDAGRLGPEPEVADAVIDRYGEALAGDARMNCDLCQFRLPLPGREKRAGLPSAGGTGEQVRDDARAIQAARAGDPDALEWKGG